MFDDFAHLLNRARSGDREALGRIAEQYEKKFRVVARVHLGPALRPYLDSQDLLQSVHRSLMVGLREDKFDISSPDAVERQIVDLRLQGFAAPEIAEQLGLTAVNVRVRMTRMRQRLIAAGVMDDWL